LENNNHLESTMEENCTDIYTNIT